MLSLKSRGELFRELVDRCRELRLRQNLTQAEVAARAGIPLGSYRRFEQEGQLTVERFVAVLHALNQVETLEQFLQPPRITDLRQLVQPVQKRQRARLRS